MSSIKQEIDSINEAKEDLAQQLIDKFGVQDQDILDGSGNVITPGLSDSSGTLKRLANWAPAISGTTQYWADQVVSTSANEETTPRFGNVGIGMAPNSDYALTTSSPIRIQGNDVAVLLTKSTGSGNLYTRYNYVSGDFWQEGVNENGNFMWGMPVHATYTPHSENAPAMAAYGLDMEGTVSGGGVELGPEINPGGDINPGMGDIVTQISELMYLEQNGNLHITGNIVNNSVSAKLSNATLTSSNANHQYIPTNKVVWDAINAGIAANDAMTFKGTVGTGGTVTSLPRTYRCGDTYKVVSEGTYAGQFCEVGDLLIAMITRETSTTNNDDWTAVQANMLRDHHYTIPVSTFVAGSTTQIEAGWYPLFRSKAASGTALVNVEANYYANISFIVTASGSGANISVLNCLNSDPNASTVSSIQKLRVVHVNGNWGLWEIQMYLSPRQAKNLSQIRLNIVSGENFNIPQTIAPYENNSSDTYAGTISCGNRGFSGTFHGYSTAILPYDEQADSFFLDKLPKNTSTTTFRGNPITPQTFDRGIIPFFRTDKDSSNQPVDGRTGGTYHGLLFCKFVNDNANYLPPAYEFGFFNDGLFVRTGPTGGTTWNSWYKIITSENAAFTGAVSTTSSITASGSITAAAFYESSDKNLKQNICDINSSDLYKVSQLNFKEFEFKSEGIKKYGVIAQDLQELNLNNLVSKTGENGHLTVDYISMLCLKVAYLEERIKYLEHLIK